jgi:hypothetical protein
VPTPSSADTAVRRLLRIATFTLLFARGWIYLRWDAPFRAMLWSEDVASPWVRRLLGISWDEYARTSNPYIALLTRMLGIFLLIAAGASLVATPARRRVCDILLLASALLCLHGYACYSDKLHDGMLIEMALHAFTPLVFVAALHSGAQGVCWKAVALPACALTFIGHGMYATGHHATPPEFLRMTVDILRLDEEPALALLRVAGYVDYLVAALIFIPLSRVRSPALIYMTVWGFLTSFARVLSHITPAEKFYGLDPWLMETVVRLTHGLTPLALWFALRDRRAEAGAPEAPAHPKRPRTRSARAPEAPAHVPV